MKKLMIAAAAAAMIGGSFADVAQVYDVKLNVKTTACKTGKISAALEKLVPAAGDKGDSIQFRKQGSRTIEGVIWGCDCITIAAPAWRAYQRQNAAGTKTTTTIGGYQFWDSTGKVAIPFYVPYTTFGWDVLNRIDQMTSVEGAWWLYNAAEGQGCDLVGAGFGKCKNAANDCDSTITSMNGSFAGLMQYESGDGDGCVFCGETEFDCLVMPFCFCSGVIDTTALTVAHGTWTLKYNSSASTKLKKTYYITDAKNFNTAKLAIVGASLDAAELVGLEAAGSLDPTTGAPVHVVKNDAAYAWENAGERENDLIPVDIDKDDYFEKAAAFVEKATAKFKNLEFDFTDPGESEYFPLDDDDEDDDDEEEEEEVELEA